MSFPLTPPPSRLSNHAHTAAASCFTCPSCCLACCHCCLRAFAFPFLSLRGLCLLRLTPHAERGTCDSVQVLQSLRFGHVRGCSGDRGRGGRGRECNGGVWGGGCRGLRGRDCGDVMVTMGGRGRGRGDMMMERMGVSVTRGEMGMSPHCCYATTLRVLAVRMQLLQHVVDASSRRMRPSHAHSFQRISSVRMVRPMQHQSSQHDVAETNGSSSGFVVSS